jgi:hypothetical protein
MSAMMHASVVANDLACLGHASSLIAASAIDLTIWVRLADVLRLGSATMDLFGHHSLIGTGR